MKKRFVLFMLTITMFYQFTFTEDHKWKAIQIREVAIENTCLESFGRYDFTRLTQVKESKKLFFQKVAKPCPLTGPCNCHKNGYLVKDDTVFASESKAGYRCVYYRTKSGKVITGFLPSNSLIDANVDSVDLEGSVSWNGRGGNIHNGEISA